MQFILAKLAKSAEEYCSFLTCTQPKCQQRIHIMAIIFMKVRLMHALKRSNAQNVKEKSGKRNRKMLKLTHA